jgi:hypothetical protein
VLEDEHHHVHHRNDQIDRCEDDGQLINIHFCCRFLLMLECNGPESYAQVVTTLSAARAVVSTKRPRCSSVIDLIEGRAARHVLFISGVGLKAGAVPPLTKGSRPAGLFSQ